MTIEEIKSQFVKVLSYSQNIMNPQVDELFALWVKNKKNRFLDFFNEENNFIYEYPKEVSFTAGKTMLRNMFLEFADNVSYFNQDLYKFLCYCYEHCNFFENIVPEDYKHNDQIIPKGHKIIKAFKYFIEDKTILEAYQNVASELIQKTRLKGKFCISINPLDYLSLSDNAHNWRSCHSSDGSYRAGNLSYMGDKSTFMCYIKSDNDTQILRFPPDVPWNSKKWRMLLFISDNKLMMMAGRQYPYTMGEETMNEISQILGAIPEFNLNFWSAWENNYINSFKTKLAYGGKYMLEDNYLLGANQKLIPVSKMIVTPADPLAFNDLLHSSVYSKPYYRFRVADYSGWPHVWESEVIEKFHIGVEVKCIQCGQHWISHETESMLCPNCKSMCDEDEDGVYCDCCGAESSTDLIPFKGIYICERCYNELTAECSDCGERYYTHQLITDLATGKLYCRHCLRDDKKESEDIW